MPAPATVPPEQPAVDRLYDYVEHWAGVAPQAPALSCDGQDVTYAALAAQSRAWASALLAAGAGMGDRVALLSKPTPEAITLYLACASVGLVFQGLNPSYTQAELEYVLQDSGAAIVLDALDGSAVRAAEDAGISEALPWAADFPLNGAVPDDALAAARAAVLPSDPVLLVHTSGSTGKPKGALIPTGALAHAAGVHSRRWLQGHGGTTLCPFPINHVASLSDVCGTALAAGMRTVLMPDFDPREVVRTLERERVTLWGFIPVVGVLATQTPEWATADLSSVEVAVWGGGAAPVPLLTALRAKGLRIQGCYGTTETVGNVVFSDGDTSDDATLARSIGWPDPAYQVRVARADGTTCETGEEGELLVRAENAFLGYLGRPEATAATIDAAGWLHTGDVAVQAADGMLSLVGRTHEMFKSGGYNVYPREIESALEGQAGVEVAAVVAVPDDVYGEVGHAFVVGDVPDPEALRTALRDRLAAYKIPKRILVVDDLPLLPVGKVDKQQLRRLARESEIGA